MTTVVVTILVLLFAAAAAWLILCRRDALAATRARHPAGRHRCVETVYDQAQVELDDIYGGGTP